MKKASVPRVFIGSSVEGLPIAKAIQSGIEYAAESTIWHQGVFEPLKSNLESLVRATGEFDFAVLVLTPDDLVVRRATNVNAPRDNVLFELGLFIGALGPERVVVVYNRSQPPDLPSDLAGIVPLTFPDRGDGNIRAAIGPACDEIEQRLRRVLPDRTKLFDTHAGLLQSVANRLMEHASRLAYSERLERDFADLKQELSTLRSIAARHECPTCGSPVRESGGGSESVELDDGREVDVDHEWATYECGGRFVDEEMRTPCPHGPSS